jgi:hypothetical protein
MTLREMDSARHVIGWHVTQETRVQDPFDDVASNILPYLGQPDKISRSDQPAPSILGDFGRVGSVLGHFAHTTQSGWGSGFIVSLGFMSGVILPIRISRLNRVGLTTRTDSKRRTSSSGTPGGRIV